MTKKCLFLNYPYTKIEKKEMRDLIVDVIEKEEREIDKESENEIKDTYV